MKKLLIMLLFLFASSILLAAENLSAYGYILNYDVDDDEFSFEHEDVAWSIYAKTASVNGIRLRGANRVKAQSTFSLNAVEPESGRRITLNSKVADEINVIAKNETSLQLEYVFEEGIRFPLSFSLEEDGLHVVVDMEKLQETEEIFIETFVLFPYFSSSSLKDDGYYMIPDGSGALLRFNNGKSGLYNESIYGKDVSKLSEVNVTNKETIRLPLYGVSKNGESCLVVCTSGAAMASIIASPSSESNPYNTCAFSFNLRNNQELRISEDAFQIVYESPRLFQGKIEVVITPVKTDGYVAMAQTFRNLYLPSQDSEKINLVLSCDMLDYEPHKFLGVSLPLKKGIENLDFNDISTALSLLPVSVSPLVEVIDWNLDQMLHKQKSHYDVSSKSGKIESVTDRAKTTFSFDPLSISKRNENTIRELSEKPVSVYDYNLNSSFIDKETRRFYLHPGYAIPLDAIEIESYYPAFGIFPEQVYTDYSEKHPLSREGYCKVASDYMKAAESHTVYGGNYYSLENAFHVYNAPLSSSGFNVLDESIPFYGIALSGCITASSSTIDSVADPDLMKLRLFESGYLPSISAKEVLSGYSFEYLEDLLSVAGCEIIDHSIDGPNKRRVKYSNGIEIQIDYQTKSYSVKEVEL